MNETRKVELVAAYVRVSTERQRQQQTIRSQLDAVLADTRSRGWTIAEGMVFIDDGYSGATLERPAWTRCGIMLRKAGSAMC